MYAEFKLKEKFGWTQAELEEEPAENIRTYLQIIHLENKRNNIEVNKANNG